MNRAIKHGALQFGAALAAVVLTLTACSSGGATEAQKQKRDAYEAALKAAGGFPYDAVVKNPTELQNVRKKLIADSDLVMTLS